MLGHEVSMRNLHSNIIITLLFSCYLVIYWYRDKLMINESLLTAMGVMTVFVSFILYAFSKKGRTQMANVARLKVELTKIHWLPRDQVATKMFQYLSVSALFTFIVFCIDGMSLKFVSWFLG